MQKPVEVNNVIARANPTDRPALIYVAASWSFLRAIWEVFNMVTAIRAGSRAATLRLPVGAAPALAGFGGLPVGTRIDIVLAALTMVVFFACALLLLWGYALGAHAFLLTTLVLLLQNVLSLATILHFGLSFGPGPVSSISLILIPIYIAESGLPYNLGALCLALWLFRQPAAQAYLGIRNRYLSVLARRIGPVSLDLLIGAGLPVVGAIAQIVPFVLMAFAIASDR